MKKNPLLSSELEFLTRNREVPRIYLDERNRHNNDNNNPRIVSNYFSAPIFLTLFWLLNEKSRVK